MVRYETLLMAVPEITADETKALETSFERVLSEHKAMLISFERWGKYKLAYPVRGNEYGVYFLTRFEVPREGATPLLEALRALLMVKFNEIVMRPMTSYLSPHISLSYHRPDSLEEAPTRDVETFLKESKMTGLLSQRSEKGRSEGRPLAKSRSKESEEVDESENSGEIEGGQL
jgi:ribosomal protein S6